MDLVQLNYASLSEAEVETLVRFLHPLKSGVQTHLRTEHFKQWLRAACHGENFKTPVYGALDVPGGYRPAHVANGGYTTGVGLDFPGHNTHSYHVHPGHRTTGDPL